MKHDHYKTPGRECVHAKSGCCPSCDKPMAHNVRFASRDVMPPIKKTGGS